MVMNDHTSRSGFALAGVLVVMAALLLLGVGALTLARIERFTGRSQADLLRARLAAEAGLEECRAMLESKAANDTYLVIQGSGDDVTLPGLFLVGSQTMDDSIRFEFHPLFSASSGTKTSGSLDIPDSGGSLEQPFSYRTLPGPKLAAADWHNVISSNGRQVARYVFWVEDMQGRLDAKRAGNMDGPGNKHQRLAAPFPAAGANPHANEDAALNQVALFAVDPAANVSKQGELVKHLRDNKPLLLTNASVPAAAGATPPMERGDDKSLADPMLRAIEESLTHNLIRYEEQALIPCTRGIDPDMVGKPKLNLNKLLAGERSAAVSEMAGHITAAAPDFASRNPFFPESYAKTLAASALDYADEDSTPSIGDGYRGIDAVPLLSEVVLQISYEGIKDVEGRKKLKFRTRLFAELCNPTNKPIREGMARLNYECALRLEPISANPPGPRFDDPALLDTAVHDLEIIDGQPWSREILVSLLPGEYKALRFAEVIYQLDAGTEWIPDSVYFGLEESRGEAGVSLMWNGDVVDRAARIVRQEGLTVSRVQQETGEIVESGGFRIGSKKTIAKAALPGLVYDNNWPSMYYNPGDPRATWHLRDAPLAESAYPENSSPNRRNIRREIYRTDAPSKPKVYARMLPSEWPDGGHNAPVGSWAPGTADATAFDDPKFAMAYDVASEHAAIQRMSNTGRFYSVCELGRVFDPLMFKPVLADQSAADLFLEKGRIPAGDRWPDALAGQESPYYCGGNTLRIGRPEHPAFLRPEMHAARLLDLFHTGQSFADDPVKREGALALIAGHVNLNTASRDVLRAMAAGFLVMDPALAKRTSADHDATSQPPTEPLKLGAPSSQSGDIGPLADRVADAVIRSRPYASASGIAMARDETGEFIFGNKDQYAEGDDIEWSDAAAEEVFARMFESSTVRSRNFRVWIVGQALAPGIGTNGSPEVLAEVRTCYDIFVDPGERDDDGSIILENVHVKVLHESEFD